MKNTNFTSSGLIKTGFGKVIGIIVNSHTNGTISLVDGLTAHNATADAATGTLTFTGVVADGQTVTIGSEVYEFDTNSSVAAGHIAVDVSGGVTAAEAVTAIVTAITADSTLVTAVDGAGDTVVVTTVLTGTQANYAVSETCTNASWGAATLTGGADATKLITNTFSFPAGSYTYDFFGLSYDTGLYVTVGGTANLTIIYE